MQNFKRLFAILGNWKPYYALSGSLLIFSTIFRMFEPKVLQVTIDGIITFFQSANKQLPEAKDSIAQAIYAILPALTTENISLILLTLCGIYVGIAFVRASSMFSSSAIAAFCTEKAIKDLRNRLFSHIQTLPLNFHGKVSTGEMIQRCTGDVETVKKFIGQQVVEVVRLFAIFFAAFYMMASIHLTYAFFAICIVPCLLFLALYFFKKEGKVWEKHEAEQDKLISIVEQNLSGNRVVKAFAQEKNEIEKFEKQNKAKIKIGVEHLYLHAAYWPLSDTLFHLQITLSLLVGGYFTLNGAITVGEFVAFYTYIIMVSWPMRQIGRVLSQMSMALVAVERLSAILDAESENYDGFDNDGKSLKGDIEFRNVWFKYPKSEEYVLKDISFSVNAGEQVALLGPTGSGKSTVIALLTRFYEPEKGEIFIDGIPLTEYSKAYLRGRIGAVLQKPFLFSTTIKGNISYALPDATESEIIEASKAANIHEIMHVFANGYDTLVGEKGVTLSGGQKQRVALARTLLENPDILILDDATSAVDTETEFQIQQALKTHLKDKTSFVIAHRMTSIQYADKILVFEKGELIEEGIHKNLMAQNGFYRKVYDVQASII
ncbi:MAG: ABC transporter ATP-binding protein [Chitinophagales bacterium]